jgi:rubrerythrin
MIEQNIQPPATLTREMSAPEATQKKRPFILANTNVQRCPDCGNVLVDGDCPDCNKVITL